MKKKTLLAGGILAVLMMMFMAMAAFAGSWENDGNGWWYQRDDGSYPKNVMTVIDDEWYCFDKYGYMKSNEWVLVQNEWYYFTGSGAMAKNQWIAGTYYVGGDGIMLTNTWTPDGYWVDELGAWVPGKTKDTGSRSSEYYTVDGNWDNRDQSGYNSDRRVDCWISLQPGDVYMGTMDFGLYMSSSTPYSLYDKNNPNGDSLAIATVDGINWGCRSTITDDWYNMTYNGKDTLTLQWKSTQWSGSGNLTFKRRSGGSIFEYGGYSSGYSNELETADIHSVG